MIPLIIGLVMHVMLGVIVGLAILLPVELLHLPLPGAVALAGALTGALSYGLILYLADEGSKRGL